jgi:hypothetical protein
MKPKVRTDYHELFSSSDSDVHEERVNHWLKSVLLVGVGFILGVTYCKTVVNSSCETLALSAVPSVAENVETTVHASTKNQRAPSKA